MTSGTNQKEVRSGIPIGEFAVRRARLDELVAERGYDGALVFSRGGNAPIWGADVLYLTNHYSAFPQIPDFKGVWSGKSYSALIMPKNKDATLIVDVPDWRRDLVAINNVKMCMDMWDGIAETLKANNLAQGRIALIGRQCVPYSAIDHITTCLPSIEFVWADDLIEQMRLIKSPAEINLLREAAMIGGEMLVAFMEAVEPGKTEADCVLAALEAGLPRGAFVTDIPVGTGAYSDSFIYNRMPSWDHQRPLHAGEMIHPDMMGSVQGYIYDLMRSTVVGGNPSKPQREFLDSSIGVVQHIISKMRPGVTCDELFRNGKKWLMDRGVGAPGAAQEGDANNLGLTWPSFGHGIGLAWESPWISPGDMTALEPGMALSIEAYVGRAGPGTAAFEQSVVITGDGCELLTKATPMVWW